MTVGVRADPLAIDAAALSAALEETGVAHGERMSHVVLEGLVSAGRRSTVTSAENLRLRRSGRRRFSVDDVLDTFPVTRNLLDRRAGLLSGGDQQMLALAGALLADQQVMTIDEMRLGPAPITVEQRVVAAPSAADRGDVLAPGHVLAEGAAAESEQLL